MVDSVETFTIVYVLMVALFNTALVLNGEDRVDAYAALNILSYYISYSLFMRGSRSTLGLKLVNALLLLVFLVIVAYRVWQVVNG